MNAISYESEATELQQLRQELAAIGSRVGYLGHASETLVLLARTTLLLGETVASLAARVTTLECNTALALSFQPVGAVNEAGEAARAGDD